MMKDQESKEAFWRGVRADFARLQADPTAWQGYVDEAALWEATGGDGLDNEEPYYSSTEVDDKEKTYLSTIDELERESK